MPPKPKCPQASRPDDPRNFWETPDYATDLIVPYIPRSARVIWEPACGSGRMVRRLRHHGFTVWHSDILTGTDFLATRLETLLTDVGAIVTNPPYSLKRQFYEQCWRIGLPFALLIPADFSSWILDAVQRGCQFLVPTRRVDYITPTGKSGAASCAQFHSWWLAYGFNLPNQLTVVELTLEAKRGVTAPSTCRSRRIADPPAGAQADSVFDPRD